MNPDIFFGKSTVHLENEERKLNSEPGNPCHPVTAVYTPSTDKQLLREGWTDASHDAVAPRLRYRLHQGQVNHWSLRQAWHRGNSRKSTSRIIHSWRQRRTSSLHSGETVDGSSSNLTKKTQGDGKKTQDCQMLNKYLWLILQILASLVSYVYIEEAYERWQSSPVVVSINNTKTSVRDIPFPAVTICSQPTLNEEYNFKGQVAKCFDCDPSIPLDNNCSAEYTPCSYNELVSLSLAYSMCLQTAWVNIQVYEEPWEAVLNYVFSKISSQGEFTTSYFKEILPECRIVHFGDIVKTFLYGCALWKTFLIGATRPVDFIDTPTEAPVCFTYNSLRNQHIYKDNVIPSVIETADDEILSKVDIKNYLWTTDNMMDFADTEMTLPIYGMDNFYILYSKEENQNSRSCSAGIETTPLISFHHPGEIPMLENTKFHGFVQDTSFTYYITPQIMIADPNLAAFEPAKRNCYFSYEHNLMLFKFYTQKNCQIECKSNCTLAQCGCVPYYLPRQNGAVKLCGKFGWECTHEIKPEKTVFYQADIRYRKGNTPSACFCDCLPDCNSISYNFEVEETTTGSTQNTTNIKVLFKDVEFSSMVRYSVNTWAEFVAYSLGILGVFNGLCGVGMCEALYHQIVKVMRFCCKQRPTLCRKNKIKRISP